MLSKTTQFYPVLVIYSIKFASKSFSTLEIHPEKGQEQKRKGVFRLVGREEYYKKQGVFRPNSGFVVRPHDS